VVTAAECLAAVKVEGVTVDLAIMYVVTAITGMVIVASCKIFAGVLGKKFVAVEDRIFVDADRISVGVSGKIFVDVKDKIFVAVEDKTFVAVEDKTFVAVEDKTFVAVEDSIFVAVEEKIFVAVEDRIFVDPRWIFVDVAGEEFVCSAVMSEVGILQEKRAFVGESIGVDGLMVGVEGG
jgi:hypothetical protein